MKENNSSEFLQLVKKLNKPWERNWYIMSPMKNPKRWFFALNMKFSMCRDYTKFFSKIAPSGKGETKNENTQVTPTILLKIFKLASKLEIFKRIVRISCMFLGIFHPSRTERFWKKILFKPKTHRLGFSLGTWCMLSLPGSVKFWNIVVKIHRPLLDHN